MNRSALSRENIRTTQIFFLFFSILLFVKMVLAIPTARKHSEDDGLLKWILRVESPQTSLPPERCFKCPTRVWNRNVLTRVSWNILEGTERIITS